MANERIPLMEPLAPIIDRMRALAREEIPAPRTCRIRMWDDGTFDLVIFHRVGDSERQAVRYERSTGEIVWEHVKGASWEAQSLSSDETVYESTCDERDSRVLTRVEPLSIVPLIDSIEGPSYYFYEP